MATDKFGEEVTQDRWDQVDLAIRAFIRRYPLHWDMFRKDIIANKTMYGLAKEGELKKSGFRNTLSFPVAARRRTPEEIELDPIANEIESMESLKETLELIIPGFTAPDENVEKKNSAKEVVPNKLYKEFIRRYASLFQPGERY
jgi:hypothetical protein